MNSDEFVIKRPAMNGDFQRPDAQRRRTAVGPTRPVVEQQV